MPPLRLLRKMSADESLMVWATENRCRVKTGDPNRRDFETKIFCRPGWHVKYSVVPDWYPFHGDRDQLQAFLIGVPVPLRGGDPRDKERLEQAQDEFQDMFPGCKFWSQGYVQGTPFTILEFQCGNVYPMEALSMMETANDSGKQLFPLTMARKELEPFKEIRERWR